MLLYCRHTSPSNIFTISLTVSWLSMPGHGISFRALYYDFPHVITWHNTDARQYINYWRPITILRATRFTTESAYYPMPLTSSRRFALRYWASYHMQMIYTYIAFAHVYFDADHFCLYAGAYFTVKVWSRYLTYIYKYFSYATWRCYFTISRRLMTFAFRDCRHWSN